MAKSKSYMALYRERAALVGPAGGPYSPHELDMIGDRTVGEILDEAEARGAITYVKPRSKLRREDEGSRDLFAHAALYQAGWRDFSVLDERNARNTPAEEWAQYKKSIDLLRMNGEYWEVKSPDAKDPGAKLRAVERALAQAEEQFAGHPVASLDQTRVVLSGRYINATDNAISSKIDAEMSFRKNIVVVAQVLRSGEIEWHHR